MTPDERAPAGPGDPRSVRRWGWLLVAVGFVYGIWSFHATHALGLGRDEVVYLSQVSPTAEPAYFSAPRSRGISWLVAPMAQLTSDVALIRLYLGALAGLCLVAAWWPWLRVRGLRSPAVAPVAAALLASLWVAQFYASQVMANLWIAFGAVAALGIALRLAEPRGFRWWRLTLLAAVVAGVTLLRPADAVVLGAFLAATSLLVLRGARWRHGVLTAVAVILGAVVGVVPWVHEAEQRFGGVSARLTAASEVQGGAATALNVGLYLRVQDGPILCRPTCRAAGQPVPVDAAALLTVSLALVVLAVVLAWRSRRLSAALAPALGALALGAPYLVGVGYAAPRFLLPTYALASLPIALALVALVNLAPGRWRALTAVLLIAGFAAHASAQQAALARIGHAQAVSRDRIAMIADFVASHGVRPPCVVSGSQAPLIAYALGCRSSALRGHDASVTRAELLELAATHQVVLTRSRADRSLRPPRWVGDGWTGYRVPGLPRRWTLTVFVPTATDPAARPTP